MSKHFSEAELKCKCGKCTYPGMDKEFMKKLESIRIRYGRPMILSSAYRCPDYNNLISHTGLSGPHTTGRAVDVKVRGSAAHEVLRLALTVGMTGIGVSQKGDGRFLHLDDLGLVSRPMVWSY